VGGDEGIHFILSSSGRASGEAYVELDSEDDLKKALAKDKCHLGRRYVDVFKARRRDMEAAQRRAASQAGANSDDVIVRIRGLPFGCSKEEIAHFFSGLMLAPNGITILTDHLGRANGQAFVRFATPDDADKALLKHKQMIGRRYIEVFKSSLEDLMMATMSISSRHNPPLGSTGGRGGASSFLGAGGFPNRGGFHGGFPGAGAGFGGFHGTGGFRGGGNVGGFRGAAGVGGFKGSIGCGGSYGQMRPYSQDDCFTSASASRGAASEFARGHRGPGYFDDGYVGFNSGYGGGGDCSGFGGFDGLDFGRGSGGGGGGGGGGSFANRGLRGGSVGQGVGMGRGIGRGAPGGGDSSRVRHSVHMRGLPYSATERDIAQFFYPLNVVNIAFQFNRDGRPSGDADVDFATHADALQAMRNNRASIKTRYIELFLNSASPDRTIQGGNFYGNSSSGGGSNALFDVGGEYTSF
jgi:RNA recognition motif-containing protein